MALARPLAPICGLGNSLVLSSTCTVRGRRNCPSLNASATSSPSDGVATLFCYSACHTSGSHCSVWFVPLCSPGSRWGQLWAPRWRQLWVVPQSHWVVPHYTCSSLQFPRCSGPSTGPGYYPHISLIHPALEYSLVSLLVNRVCARKRRGHGHVICPRGVCDPYRHACRIKLYPPAMIRPVRVSIRLHRIVQRRQFVADQIVSVGCLRDFVHPRLPVCDNLDRPDSVPGLFAINLRTQEKYGTYLGACILRGQLDPLECRWIHSRAISVASRNPRPLCAYQIINQTIRYLGYIPSLCVHGL